VAYAAKKELATKVTKEEKCGFHTPRTAIELVLFLCVLRLLWRRKELAARGTKATKEEPLVAEKYGSSACT
jgi:hypothetical protein